MTMLYQHDQILHCAGAHCSLMVGAQMLTGSVRNCRQQRILSYEEAKPILKFQCMSSNIVTRTNICNIDYRTSNNRAQPHFAAILYYN